MRAMVMPDRPQSSPGEGKRRTPRRSGTAGLRPWAVSPCRPRGVSGEATAGYTTVDETGGGMSEREARQDDDEAVHGTNVVGQGGPAEDRTERREPASEEEAEQDNYANTDDQEA